MSKKPGPAIEKNITRTNKNIQAQNLLRISAGLPRTLAGSRAYPAMIFEAFMALLSTDGTLRLAYNPTSRLSMTCLTALVDRSLCFRSIYVASVDHHVAGGDTLLDTTGVAIERHHGIIHGGLTHLARQLCDHKIDNIIPQIGNCLLRRIKVGDLDRTLFIGVLDRLSRALSTEQVGA